MSIKPGWIPKASPYCLIQEHLFPDEWMIIVVCIMLNQTSRKQVDKVLPVFMGKWSNPNSFLKADKLDVIETIKPLGLSNRRYVSLSKMTRAYLTTEWDDVRDLPGVGEYAARAWEMFCLGKAGDSPPKDHALVNYYNWLLSSEQLHL